MKQPFCQAQTVILVAIEEELPQHLAPGWKILYTGVGKINAALKAKEAIEEYGPKVMINYGTAGAVREGLDGLHEVTMFRQRDMDVRPLGFSLGATPFDDVGDIQLPRNGLSCGTGDNFATARPQMPVDLVDMEAYALAKACHRYGVDFYCFKFVSDGVNHRSAQDWSQSMALGASAFVQTVLPPPGPGAI